MGSIDWSQVQSQPTPQGAIDWSQIGPITAAPIQTQGPPAPPETYQNKPAVGLIRNVPQPNPEQTLAGLQAATANVQAPDQTSPAGRLWQGIKDPAIGASQTAAHLMPAGLSNMGSMGAIISPVVNATQQLMHATPPEVDALVRQQNAAYEQSRGPQANTMDWWRLGGNVASPVNALAATAGVPPSAGFLGKVGQGAAIGAGASALAPVTSQNYAQAKAGQAAVGAITGGTLAPIIGAISNKLSALVAGGSVPADQAATAASQAVDQVVQEAGQTGTQIPADQVSIVKAQVAQALSEGNDLDAAAALRKLDFQKAGVTPMTGQITRDPVQFAAEQNASHAPGGEPIVQTMNMQAQQLASGLKAMGGAGQATDPQLAGNSVITSLQNTDSQMAKAVSSAYATARANSGAQAEIPLQGLSQAYANVVRDFGDKVPSGVRNNFEQYGLQGGTQLKTFTVDDAERLLQNINANVSNDPATNNALSQLRTAVKSAVTEGGGGPFDQARQLASERFRLQEQIPALGAASQEKLDPGTFFNRYVLNSPDYREVQKLGTLLQQTDPAAYQTVRQQLGATLQQAGFGQNVTGDKAFSPERYNAMVAKLGPKLDAFFSPDEVQQIQRFGRVGAYMSVQPSGSPVNVSRSAGTMAKMLQWGGSKLLGLIPGGEALGNVIGGASQIGKNQAALAQALSAQVPTTASAEQQRLAQMLYGPAVAGSAAVASQQNRP